MKAIQTLSLLCVSLFLLQCGSSLPPCTTDVDCNAGKSCLGPDDAKVCVEKSNIPTDDDICYVLVKSASLSKERDWDPIDPPEPYVTIEIPGEEKFTTSSNVSTYKPTWNEKSPSYPYKQIKQMKVILLDKDTGGTGVFRNDDDHAGTWDSKGNRWFVTNKKSHDFELTNEYVKLKIAVKCP